MKTNLFTKTALILSLTTLFGLIPMSANTNQVNLTNINNIAIIESDDDIQTNESSAIEIMRLLHSVQVTYIEREGKGSFGSAKDLFMVAYIDGSVANALGCPKLEETTYKQFCSGTGEARHGYKFQISSTKAENGKPAAFAAVAFPVLGKGNKLGGTRSFYVDESGVIRFSSDPNVIANAKSAPLGS